MRRPQRQNITGQVPFKQGRPRPRHKQTGKRRSRAGQPAQDVIRNMKPLLSVILLLAATLAVGCSGQETRCQWR